MEARDIDNRFTHHPPPNPQRIAAHKEVREAGRVFAHLINDLLPEGREKENAVSRMEEVVFWANAGLARQNYPEEDRLGWRAVDLGFPESTPLEVRSNHPFSFRSGQWGRVVDIVTYEGKECYLVQWTKTGPEDHTPTTDYWATDDTDWPYDFRRAVK